MEHTDDIQVMLTSEGFYPHVYRWRGRQYRVLAVEGMQMRGSERRYQVRSNEGHFELGWDLTRDVWRVRRSPNWLDRQWVQWRHGARYPLPAWRRRAGRRAGQGGNDASRFALVR